MQHRLAGAVGLRAFTQVAKDVLDHDHRRIDDQPEIDRADRQKVGRLTAHHHQHNRECQCERNRRRHDDGAAQVAQKRPLQEEDQCNPDQQVVHDGVRGQVDQVTAVVDFFKAHAGRQDTAVIDFLDFGLHPVDGGFALRAAPHQHGARNDVIVGVQAGNAQTRLAADCHRGHIAKPHRAAAVLRHHRRQHVIGRPDQPHAPHHHRLRSQVHGLSANVGVAAVQRQQHLAQRDALGGHQFRVDGDVVRLRLATPTRHIDDARNGLETALQHPVLQRFQVGD